VTSKMIMGNNAQEALKLPAVPGEGGGPGVGGMRLADGAAALARLEVAAVAQSPLMGAAAADGAAAEDAAAAAASIDTTASHTTADAAPQDEAVMSRAGGVMETVAGGGGGPSGGRAAAGNALGDVQLPSGADVALLAGAVAVAAGGKSLEVRFVAQDNLCCTRKRRCTPGSELRLQHASCKYQTSSTCCRHCRGLEMPLHMLRS